MNTETIPQTANELSYLPLERQIVWTKFSVPHLRDDRISRARLIDRLEVFGQSKLTLVTAPAGWGKSTFLAQLAGLRAGHTTWISLDEADNAVTEFLVYLCCAFNQLCEGSASDALLLLSRPKPPSAKTIINLAINKFSSLTDKYLLILDDYHVISAPEIHEAMEHLIDRLPSCLSIAIASRTQPDLPVSRLRARGELLEITSEDLRFTKSEASELFASSNHLNLSDEAVQELQKKTEGWAAGLQLAALSLRGVRDPEAFVKSFTGANRYIVDYLVDEALAGQPQEIQDFLLSTSILSRFSAGLCDAVTEISGSQIILDLLDRSNLFLIALDDQRKWYRYHHLFADALRSRLIGRRPELVGELHLRAAAWLSVNGAKREAIDHALASRHFDVAAEHINKWAQEDWCDGNFEAAKKWIEALPRDVLLANPTIMIRLAQIYLFQSKVDLAQKLVDIVETLPEAAEPPLLGDLQATQLHLTRFLGDNAKSLDLSHKALESLNNFPDKGIRTYVHINLGSLYLECGEIEKCIKSLDSAVNDCLVVQDVRAELMIYSTRAQAFWGVGNLDQADRSLTELDELLARYSLDDSLESSLAASPKMELLYERNQLEDAVKTAAPYLEMPIAELSIPVIIALAYALSAQGKTTAALELLSEWEAALKHTPVRWVLQKIPFCRAFLLRSDRAATDAWLKSMESETGLSFCDVSLNTIQKARFYCDRHMFKEAISAASPTLKISDTLKCFDISLKLRAVLAAAEFALGEKARAIETLTPALDLGENQGYVRAFIDVGELIAPLLRHAAACEIHPAYCSKLLSSATFGEPESRDELSEREIEVLKLVAMGRSNAQIAETLYLSPGTIKRHIYNISSKLGASNRMESVLIAKRMGRL